MNNDDYRAVSQWIDAEFGEGTSDAGISQTALLFIAAGISAPHAVREAATRLVSSGSR